MTDLRGMSWHFCFLIPVFCGVIYWLLTNICIFLFFRRKVLTEDVDEKKFPFVSLIRPVCGLEKNLYQNLKSSCEQDYPSYEVIFSVQNKKDPAIVVLKQIQKEFPKVHIVIDESSIGPNGRLSNIYNASKATKAPIWVFSDSDCFLPNHYLKTIVAPLILDPDIGVSCTVYKAAHAKRWFEKMELLSMNTDFVPSMIFATMTRASLACPGASQAVRKNLLEKIGGLEVFSDYLVEDFELGRRITKTGSRIYFSPYVIDTTVDLKNAKAWWRHQVYWDQNTRAAMPIGFFLTLLIRGLPFAFLYALVGGIEGWKIFGATLLVRLWTATLNALQLKDKETLKALWLLPLRDMVSFITWCVSFMGRKIFWKGRWFKVRQGKMVEVF